MVKVPTTLQELYDNRDELLYEIEMTNKPHIDGFESVKAMLRSFVNEMVRAEAISIVNEEQEEQYWRSMP